MHVNHFHMMGYDPYLGDDEVTGKTVLTVYCVRIAGGR